jgi:arylsulfatase A-like enzyme
MRLGRRSFMKAGAATLGAALAGAGNLAAGQQPGATPANPEREESKPMNIIILVSDTYRFDNLSDRAAMPVRTPCLDAFRERATSLTRFYTGSFPTIPHRTDMTSGRLGWPWFPWQRRELSTRNHLPMLLGQAGYVSQLICDCPHLFNFGFDKGFSAAMALRGQEADLHFLRMNHAIEQTMPPEKTRDDGPHLFQKSNLPDLHKWQNRDWQGEEDRFPPRTAATVTRWLEENYQFNPFFLWVDFFDPHEPWDPPEYMVRRYDPDYGGCPMIHPNYGKASDLTPAELRNLRAHYCAEAELVDRWVGRVLQKIDDLRLWDNTIVIFTTDHGISLGEHNRTGKSNINPRDDRHWPLYPDLAHIPLLIAAPGLRGGQTVDALVQPVDILPTLLDLAGITVDPPEPFHGTSFAPLLRGESANGARDCAVAGGFLRAADGKLPGGQMTPVLYTEHWAYAPIGQEGTPELYDLRKDPEATANVAANNPGVLRDMHERLLAWFGEAGAPAEAVEVFSRQRPPA